MTERVLIVIPCYNEVGSIADLLSEVARHHSLSDVLVIDDGSVDGTADRLPPGVRCLRLDRNEGVGRAIRQAVQVAWDEGYDFVVRLDGDGQHPPTEISALFQHHQKTRSNVVVGSRFSGPDHPGSINYAPSWDRRFGIWVLRNVLRSFFGVSVDDPTSGFRLLDRTAMAHILSKDPTLFPEPVELARAAQSGLTIGETRVRMRPRSCGVSSITGWKKISYLPRVLWDMAQTGVSGSIERLGGGSSPARRSDEPRSR